MKKLLKELSNKNDRAAQFRTVIALVDGGQTTYFEGKVRGQIALEISGTEGFGYDPIFIPDGYESTFAELSGDVKNTISHRARAVGNLLLFFDQFTLSNQ